MLTGKSEVIRQVTALFKREAEVTACSTTIFPMIRQALILVSAKFHRYMLPTNQAHHRSSADREATSGQASQSAS